MLLQVSDPHFGTQRPQVVEALLQLARRLAPDAVVLSGDVTQRARRRQFAQARDFVDSLPACDVLAIPGNHDIPLFNLFARFVRPYGNYARCFGDDFEQVLDLQDALVLGVNTTRWYRHKHGEVSVMQVERVAARLQQAAPGQVRVVVVHQPVVAIEVRDEVNVLRGAERAVRAWSAAGADVILGGHIHLPYVFPLRHAYGGLERHVIAAQAGTAVSARVRNGVPNSVNLLRCAGVGESRSCTIERWDYLQAKGAFEMLERHEFGFGPA